MFYLFFSDSISFMKLFLLISVEDGVNLEKC